MQNRLTFSVVKVNWQNHLFVFQDIPLSLYDMLSVSRIKMFSRIYGVRIKLKPKQTCFRMLSTTCFVTISVRDINCIVGIHFLGFCVAIMNHPTHGRPRPQCRTVLKIKVIQYVLWRNVTFY